MESTFAIYEIKSSRHRSIIISLQVLENDSHLSYYKLTGDLDLVCVSTNGYYTKIEAASSV
eukprot:snap_masked-scaffold_2-processed-gene-23.33-mRNA-1 protein AED:1.00 eAED:1.00 QI:0/0/0/0/1/1/2/0/60